MKTKRQANKLTNEYNNFMTPFIIWLEKEEVDLLLGSILRSDNNSKINSVLTQNELLELAENVLKQNNELIKLFKKIQPFDKLQQTTAQMYGVQKKCDFYKEQVSKMKVHCSMHKDLTNCNQCPTNNISNLF